MIRRIDMQVAAALMTGLAAALTVNSASAAIWTWACQGELGGQRILFDQSGLYIAGGNGPAGKPGKFTLGSIQDAIAAVKSAGGFIGFGLDKADDELASHVLVFSLTDDKKQKVVFTERSSKRISHKHRIIACRDEDTDLYRKVYRYERDGEPARDIAMQCVEYQLSTRGGRKDCD
jgi:hypothetical protein